MDKKVIFKLIDAYGTIKGIKDYVDKFIPIDRRDFDYWNLLCNSVSSWWYRIWNLLYKENFFSSKTNPNIYYFVEMNNIIKHPDIQDDFDDIKKIISELQLQYPPTYIKENPNFKLSDKLLEKLKEKFGEKNGNKKFNQYMTLALPIEWHHQRSLIFSQYFMSAIKEFNKLKQTYFLNEWIYCEKYKEIQNWIVNVEGDHKVINYLFLNGYYCRSKFIDQIILNSKIKLPLHICYIQAGCFEIANEFKKVAVRIDYFPDENSYLNQFRLSKIELKTETILIDVEKLIDFKDWNVKGYLFNFKKQLKQWYEEALKTEHGSQLQYNIFLIGCKLGIFKDSLNYHRYGYLTINELLQKDKLENIDKITKI